MRTSTQSIKNKIGPFPMRNVHRCSSAGNPSVVGYLGLVYHISGAAYRIRGCNRSGYCVSGRYAHRNSPHVYSDGIGDRDSFCDAACRQNPLAQVDARFSSSHMEPSARCHSGYCTGHAGTYSHMDVRYEPEQYEQFYSDLVHSGCRL